MKETGVIKFNCNWIKDKPVDFALFAEMNNWRNRLYSLGLIGVNRDGIGYGNISTRFFQNQFIITGSSTGAIRNLTLDHYTKVTSYHIGNNSLTAQGPIIASSESLTHAAIYEMNADIQAVIHVHHEMLWNKLIHKIPTSEKSIEYGTPAMANEIRRLYIVTDLSVKKILIMGGHQDGVITFGNSIQEAGAILLEHFNLIKE